jgi:hypothetical protein
MVIYGTHRLQWELPAKSMRYGGWPRKLDPSCGIAESEQYRYVAGAKKPKPASRQTGGEPHLRGVAKFEGGVPRYIHKVQKQEVVTLWRRAEPRLETIDRLVARAGMALGRSSKFVFLPLAADLACR